MENTSIQAVSNSNMSQTIGKLSEALSAESRGGFVHIILAYGLLFLSAAVMKRGLPSAILC